MTSAQRIHLMADLWPRACRCQGWPSADRALRLRVLSEAVGREIHSASELDATGDYDAVKAHLGMLADNLKATIETDHPEQGRARRLRAVIRRQLADLGQFGGDPHALLAKLILDKFGGGYDLDDLTADPIIRTDRVGQLRESASQLDQMMFTLARIISSKRKAAKAAAADRLAA